MEEKKCNSKNCIFSNTNETYEKATYIGTVHISSVLSNISRSTTISINLHRKPCRYLIFVTHSRVLLIRTYGLMDRWKMCLNIISNHYIIN